MNDAGGASTVWQLLLEHRLQRIQVSLDGGRVAGCVVHLAAGIPRHSSTHSLRHAAVTKALNAGVPLRDAQFLAQHAAARTTQHYDAPEASSTDNASTS